LSQLDDDALAALASVGILRRARKDLETLKPTVIAARNELTVDLGSQRVTFDERGPSHARCTCPARSTCQHVLSALLYLRETTAEGQAAGAKKPAATPELLGELLAITPTELMAYAGRAAVREALELVEASPDPVIVLGPPLLIRLVQPPLEIRYAGGGLDALILNYRGKRRAQLIAQVILALQRASGITMPELPRRASRGLATLEVPRVFLDHVRGTLRECIEIGVAHLSENMVERLLSHGAAAEGQGLHRLALSLKRLGAHVDLQLGRSAATSTEALLDELTQAFALTEAISHATRRVPVLWGEARGSFQDVSQLELIGVAAEPWQTPSGYNGLTLLMWSPSQKRWLSATEARPTGLMGFDPTTRYRASGPWAGLESPAAACGAFVRLGAARVGPFGRLSLSEKTRASASPLTQWPEFYPVEYSEWAPLRVARPADSSAGLVERDPHAAYVVLRPVRWGPPAFDPIRQVLSRTLVDAKGDELLLTLRHSQLNSHGIDRLESLQPRTGARVVARLLQGAELVAQPIALLHDEGAARADNLLLDAAPKESVLDPLLRTLKALVPEAASTADDDATTGLPSVTSTRLRALEQELLHIAERGSAAQDTRATELNRLTEAVCSAGLSLPSRNSSAKEPFSEYLLRLRYLTTVARALA
jgi:hypothetical protein